MNQAVCEHLDGGWDLTSRTGEGVGDETCLSRTSAPSSANTSLSHCAARRRQVLAEFGLTLGGLVKKDEV